MFVHWKHFVFTDTPRDRVVPAATCSSCDPLLLPGMQTGRPDLLPKTLPHTIVDKATETAVSSLEIPASASAEKEASSLDNSECVY